MPASFWVQHQTGLLVFLGALLLIALANSRLLRRIESYRPGAAGEALGSNPFPRVSILVPARDEERNIEPCLRSLLAQQYPDFEILALDDASQDRTGAILTELAAEKCAQGRLRLLPGKELPPGWQGKAWACSQLAGAAQGELLLFTDADTRHHSLALADAVAALQAERADLLSVFPAEELVTLGEKLTVPLIGWSLFTFIPLGLARRLRLPALAAAVGQYLLFSREAYEHAGGHESVRAHAAEDLALARRLVAQGMHASLLDGGGRVRCRMYTGFGEAVEGLSKNLFAAFNYQPVPFAFVWLWLGVVFLEPLAVLTLALLGRPLPGFSTALGAAGVVLALLLWGLYAWRFSYPLSLALLYPLVILLGVALAARSLVLSLTGQARWKGRALPKQ